MAKPKAKKTRSTPKAKSKAKPAAKAKAKAKPAAKTKTKTKPAAKAKAKAKPAAKPKPKAKPAAKPAAMPAPIEQADLMRMDGMKVPSREDRTASVEASKVSPHYATVRKVVLDLFRGFYPANPPESDAQILDTDPNDFDIDPGPFYEMLGERFGLGNDPDNEYFGGFGGKVETTIANIAKRWDGKLRK